jgi:ATP-dependent HslUV protease subunit HslV
VCGIGSGGIYAQCAALALVEVPGMGAEEIARRAMKIASDTCIYTNHNYVCMTLKTSDPEAKSEKKK